MKRNTCYVLTVTLRNQQKKTKSAWELTSTKDVQSATF